MKDAIHEFIKRINFQISNRDDRVIQKTREFGQRSPRYWLGSLSAAIASVCAYPVLFIYFHNIQESDISQVFRPILIFVAVGFFAWVFFWLLSGRMSKGALAALFFMLVFMNYALLEAGIRRLIPDWRWWRIAPTLLFLFINLALAQRFFIKRPEADAHIFKLTLGIGAVFFALTVFNAGAGAFTFIQLARSAAPSPAVDHSSAPDPLSAKTHGRRPNFYFFIFDGYARQDVLKKYADFDNGPFLKGLESKKFNVSHSSHSTASSTRVSLGNTLYYSIRFQRDAETMNGIKFPPLLDVFKKAGYSTYIFSPVYRFAGSLTDVMMRSTSVLTALSIEKTVLEQSFFAYLQTSGNEAMRQDRLSLLLQAAAVIEGSSQDPKFLFCHLIIPHEPFIFDENGGAVAYENMHNWIDAKYYSGQLRFTSKKMEELVRIILRSDPGAVVLMQSDHGARAFSGMNEEERRASFNSLYLHGQEADIEGLSTINTLRLAMNHALGLKLNMLED